jgi:putative component of toxin-antitoxin plasmid stabilization module
MVRGTQCRSLGKGRSSGLPIDCRQLVERERRRAGVFERKIDAGPGYRVYFGKDGDRLVILLGGSTKQRRQQAIETAKERWADYRRRKSSKKT